MNYSKINYCDISNGPGIRVSLFVSGCRNHCKGCFNKETWDFNYGEKFTLDTLADILDQLDNYYISGLSILGGEPFEPENQECVCDIVSMVYKPIWIYTGYTIETIPKTLYTKDIIHHIDTLVDGPFIEELKVLDEFRGSSNQRILNYERLQLYY